MMQNDPGLHRDEVSVSTPQLYPDSPLKVFYPYTDICTFSVLIIRNPFPETSSETKKVCAGMSQLVMTWIIGEQILVRNL